MNISLEPFLVFVLLVFLAVMVAVVVWVANRKRGFSLQEKTFFKKRWQDIASLPDGYRAVLEADKLLDYALKKKNYSGTLGEKLKVAATLFSDINGVWWAHKLRNRLAHDVHTRVSAKDTEKALRSFKRALKDLDALS